MSTHPDSALRALETLKYHPSILKIKEFMTDKSMSFSFGNTTEEKTYKTLQNLDKKKTCRENDIYIKITKSRKDIFSYFIHHNSITQCTVNFSLRIENGWHYTHS